TAFGSWIEANARQARVYSETSGTNPVVLESVTDLAKVLRALAGSLCLFSGQMCTTPQNFFVPFGGVRTPEGPVRPAEFARRLAEAAETIIGNPRRAASICGAVQSARTVDELARLAEVVGDRGTVVLQPRAWRHPDEPAARTIGPLVALLDIADHHLYRDECFGPVAFVITAGDAEQALRQAAADASEPGAITAFVYSTDAGYLRRAEDAFALAGAALTMNLTGSMPIQFSAAYADYHVSGLNPSGNATLCDDTFVAGRFRVVQSRRPMTSTSGVRK
ncbi:MAG TPA: aldehyde dehydrogenase family protein, partial [Pseudonocardia sp.]